MHKEVHDLNCDWPKGNPCLEFSTDGTAMGAVIAHTMGTNDEEEIKQRFYDEKSIHLTGMEEEQRDWDAN